MFFVAYALDGQDLSKRPLTFAFNGGPGSASVWLHMGALGPRRVRLNPEGFLPPAPYRMEDNPYTLLDKSDLVLVDAIGTGFSRPETAEIGKKFWGGEGRHRRLQRIYSPVHQPLRAVGFAAVSSGRELWHHSADLGYKTDMPYYVFAQGSGFEKWEWGSAIEGFPDTATALRGAIVRNPYLKVLVMEGYYDMATPYFAVNYTMQHLDLPPKYQAQISYATYNAGHMVYLPRDGLKKMKQDESAFIDKATTE
jgi:carboxypeptidase C (cathepsin A)